MRERSHVWYDLPVAPRAKGRPRSKMLPGGRMISYTPRETATAERDIRTLLVVRRPICYPADVPLDVSIHFRMRPPERRIREHPTTKPDLDNLAKTVLDACNGILWADDAQIVRLTLTKVYADVQGTEGVLIGVETV